MHLLAMYGGVLSQTILYCAAMYCNILQYHVMQCSAMYCLGCDVSIFLQVGVEYINTCFSS